jgi:hypothetical protein
MDSALTQDSLGKEFTISFNDVEITGKITDLDNKGYTIRMIRPFSGLSSFIPFLDHSENYKSPESQIKAGLLLLYKKADYYKAHRKEIEKLYADSIEKLDEKKIDAAKQIWFDKFNKKKNDLKRKLEEGEIEDSTYEQEQKKARRKLLLKLQKLDKAQNKLEKKLFSGVLKPNDIKKLNAFFSKNHG